MKDALPLYPTDLDLRPYRFCDTKYAVRRASHDPRPSFSFSEYMLALIAAAQPPVVAAAEPLDRLTQEAIALFRNVIEGRAEKLGPCELSDRWISYAIPEEVGRKYLGLKLHAGLSSPSTTTIPADVIDPAQTMRQTFCDNANAKRRREALVEDLRSGTLKIEKGRYIHPTLVFPVREYTFPVFDSGYRRAVIVATGSSTSWSKVSEGEVRSNGIEGGGAALVYVKRNRGWQMLAREQLFSFH